MAPVFEMPVTFRVPLASDVTFPVKYSTFVSAPPEYRAVPHEVFTERFDVSVLFLLSTISSKISETV